MICNPAYEWYNVLRGENVSKNRNIAKCSKCGDIIESKFRHDMQWCKCKAIFVDGGHDYHRIGGNLEDFVALTEEEMKELGIKDET